MSLDADLLLEPVDENIANMLKEAVGQDSVFEQQYGYYADILRPLIAETLPVGWEARLHPVPGFPHVFTLDPYDLAVVKLAVGRGKDLDLVRQLFKLGILEPIRLRNHYQQTSLDEQAAVIAGRNLSVLLREIGVS